MNVPFILLVEVIQMVVTDGAYKGVCISGGAIKKASGHMMDLVSNRWYIEGSVQQVCGGASGEVTDNWEACIADIGVRK
jgi:hypothetical protein